MLLLLTSVDNNFRPPDIAPILTNRIVGAIVSVLLSSVVDRVFKPRSGQPKDSKIRISCFSAKHPELRRKSKNWSDWNQDNVFEWGNMSICELFFQ